MPSLGSVLPEVSPVRTVHDQLGVSMLTLLCGIPINSLNVPIVIRMCWPLKYCDSLSFADSKANLWTRARMATPLGMTRRLSGQKKY
jgi:hypothetical protein